MKTTPETVPNRRGAEWTKHIAGRALAERDAARIRAEKEAIWREVEAFIPCG